jgi:hypothetical protein
VLDVAAKIVRVAPRSVGLADREAKSAGADPMVATRIVARQTKSSRRGSEDQVQEEAVVGREGFTPSKGVAAKIRRGKPHRC